ncbi:MAG: saccharopine dehydrogenase C-terminal domain-containing protein [Candidatus Zixiibacteriota bacterium]
MRIAVIGAGLMGRAVLFDLARNEDIQSVGLFDINAKLASDIAARFGGGKASASRLDASDVNSATKVLAQYDAVVSCVPYHYNTALTRAAIKAKCHFLDLGGNNDIVRTQLLMDEEAKGAGVIVIPDCGLAPGMTSILAADGLSKFDHVKSLKIRVGGLPQSPRPPLNYQMVFSAEGLINEYWEPCLILKNGKKEIVRPMTGLEHLEFDGIGKLEAFYTSGGTSTLPETYMGKVDFLDYKTIRYPGHCRLFTPMLEIGLASRQTINVDGQMVEPRAVFRAVLDKSLSFGEPDMVLVRLTFEGEKDGSSKCLIYEIVDRHDPQTGLTAMMRTTAFPAAIIAWMVASGQITQQGCQPQELVVDPTKFVAQLKKRGIKLTVRSE